MPFYLFTARYSTGSIKAMVDKPQDRETAAREVSESVGAKLHSFYLAFGVDDVVAIIEAPDDETVAALSMKLGASGAFSSGATTKLLTSAQAQAAMKKAGSVKYSPPG